MCTVHVITYEKLGLRPSSKCWKVLIYLCVTLTLYMTLYGPPIFSKLDVFKEVNTRPYWELGTIEEYDILFLKI